MNIYCDGERTQMRVRGQRWACDRCGKLLWRYDVAKKKPKQGEVAVVYVYPGFNGFRYTCRGHDGSVLYDSERGFKSRYQARDEALSYWPEAKVSFERV